jgi:hypothetical protein
MTRRWLGSMICSRRSAPPRWPESAAALLAGTPLTHARLVAHFAALAPRHALAAIRAARLSEATWLELVPRLPIQARGFLRHRRDLGPAVEALLSQLGIDDFALAAPDLPPAEPAAMAQPEPEPDSAPASAEVIAFEQPAPLLSPAASEGIGAIVRRIEAFRRDRETRPAGQAPAGGATASPADPHPRLPFADEPPPTALHPESIDLAIDALGTVVAADADWAPMLVGHRPFTGQPHAPARLDGRSIRAFAARRPITAGLLLLEGAPAIAGAWQIDAVPVFARAGGAFAGYRARLRRPPGEASAPAQSEAPATQGADRLRQTLHVAHADQRDPGLCRDDPAAGVRRHAAPVSQPGCQHRGRCRPHAGRL